MSSASRLTMCGALTLLGCLEKFELPPSSEPVPIGVDGAPNIPPTCGARDSPCCAPPEAACGPELRCDEDAARCVDEEPRLCTSLAQCHPGQTCCQAGVLGACVSLPPGGVCPQPDLAISTTQETLALAVEQRVFAPETSAADACAIEKGCVGGAGLRQLLRFSLEVENLGDADLLIGSPETSPVFETAACDGQRYFPNYLSYQLFDIGGRQVAVGRAQARCQSLPPAFSSRFNCEFWGLWSGFSESFFPNVSEDGADPAAVDCQWLDVTGLSEGEYLLRVTVDPGGVLAEPVRGNQRDFEVTLPALGEPTRACPLIQRGVVDATGGGSLFGLETSRECGWSILPSTLGGSCTPNEVVTLTCPSCIGFSEDPMLRVCEGLEPCLALEALSAGDDTYVALDTTAGTAEQLPLLECLAVAEQDPFRYECSALNACPITKFTCPESGIYTVLVASKVPEESVSCDVTRRVESSADAGL